MQINASPWSADTGQLLKQYKIESQSGLPKGLIEELRRAHGANRLTEKRPKSVWSILWNQLNSLIVYLLTGAAAVAFLFHEILEGAAIIAVIAINALIGFITEIRAVRSMEALKKLGGISARVRRDGHVREIPAEELVVGDIIILEGGDLISADMRLITASKIQTDESSLTGESMPVNKSPESLEESTLLAERKNMLYKGTALTRGTGEAMVTAVGMNTELGHISDMIQQAGDESTPLEDRLDKLGRSLVWVTLGIALVVAVAGILAGKGIFLMIETAIALAVAAIPEGLPIVATIALARGMFRMARRNALIRRLSAVETLGATTVIFTDKTGTLTENRMTVSKLILDSGDVTIGKSGPTGQADSVLNTAMEILILCNNASLQTKDGKSSGDPLEIALLEAASKSGFDIDKIREDYPEANEDAFDSDTKRMATWNKHDKGYHIYIKGAPDVILKDCTRILTESGERAFKPDDKNRWLQKNLELGENGLRVLAMAVKKTNTLDVDPYREAVFVGLIALLDPPRDDVKPAMEACHAAGIRVIMVTGDQPVTAKNIGMATGLIKDKTDRVMHSSVLKPLESMSHNDRNDALDTPVFARVSPGQKLDLIALHQEQGEIVAMTGDGVNDAPALKKADIGVAMGLRGTQVAQEAADMVLKDDSFATIVKAIEQGRIIFENIRKAVQFLLSCNVSEVLAVGLASLVNAPLPILPLQILFLNLVTDVFPALALSVGEGDPHIMQRPPRSPKESILGRGQWIDIFIFGLLMTVSVLGSLALAIRWLGMDYTRAVSVSFLTLGFNQLWHVFNMRARGSSFFNNDITRNPMAWGAILICAGLLFMAVYVPGLAAVLKVSDPGKQGWLLILAASLFPWISGQIIRSIPSK